jgi:deoxycytidylate deaminase
MEPGLRRALKLLNNHPEKDLDYRHAAVLAKGGRILSSGFNSKKTHPHAPARHGAKTIHAEIAALLPLGVIRRRPGTLEDVEDFTLYIARTGKTSAPLLSRPCEICWDEIRRLGILRIVYTIEVAPYFREEYL